MGRRTLGGEIGAYLGDRQTHRAWALAAQDGIISTAGILLGFSGAGASERTLAVAGTAAIVAGMLTAGGAKWAEMAAEREAERQAISDERRDLRHRRAAEREATIAYYLEKDLSPALAAQVADELMLRSPLKAALEAEHGIVRLTSAADVAIAGIGTALAFGLGAAVPFAMAYFLPADIEIGLIVFSVVLSLALISVAGARAGRMGIWPTMRRTFLIASVTIVVSYVVGDLAF